MNRENIRTPNPAQAYVDDLVRRTPVKRPAAGPLPQDAAAPYVADLLAGKVVKSR